MSTLKKIRELNLETDKIKEYEKNNYINPSNLALITKIIKEQNRKLLNHIALMKNMSKKDKKEMFSKFWKLNYYTPTSTHPSFEIQKKIF